MKQYNHKKYLKLNEMNPIKLFNVVINTAELYASAFVAFNLL